MQSLLQKGLRVIESQRDFEDFTSEPFFLLRWLKACGYKKAD